MSTPIENAITTAWTEAFEQNLPSGPNLNYIPNILSQAQNQTLGDVDNVSDSTGEINLCYVPFDNYSPVPDGNASISFTGMKLTGFGTATGSPPCFGGGDTTVALPMTVSTLTIQGNFSMSQPCCTPTIVKCFSTSPASQDGGFTLVLNTNTITLNCSIGSQTGVVLNTVSFQNTGDSNITLSIGGPSWLQWLVKLIAANAGIGKGIQSQVSNLLSSSQLMGAMQKAINGLMAGEGAKSLLTRDAISHLAISGGLPPGSRAYGDVALSSVDGGTRYALRFASSDGGTTKGWLGQVTVTTDPDGQPHYQIAVASIGSGTSTEAARGAAKS